MSALETKAMIVNLNTSVWGASKSDRELARELTDQHDAADGTARVRKQLINAEAIKPVHGAVESAKAIHKQLTLPWSDHGERLLPVKLHDQYKERMQSAIDRVDMAKRKFLDQYEDLIEKAKDELGSMFQEGDYPPSTAIGRKFGVEYEILPVPSANHFIADIGDKEAKRIKADLERRVKIKLDAAIVSLYEQIEESLGRLIERLGRDDDGNPRRIHESALDAIKTLAAAVPNLNLTNDKKLNMIAKRLDKVLSTVAIDDLRFRSRKPGNVEATNRLREDLSTELGSIADAYFGGTAKK